jgi:hypothetical protein
VVVSVVRRRLKGDSSQWVFKRCTGWSIHSLITWYRILRGRVQTRCPRLHNCGYKIFRPTRRFGGYVICIHRRLWDFHKNDEVVIMDLVVYRQIPDIELILLYCTEYSEYSSTLYSLSSRVERVLVLEYSITFIVGSGLVTPQKSDPSTLRLKRVPVPYTNTGLHDSIGTVGPGKHNHIAHSCTCIIQVLVLDLVLPIWPLGSTAMQ